MSIFDNLHVDRTHMRYYQGIRPPQINTNMEKTGEIKDCTLDRNEEYILTLTVSQQFWANSVQATDARKYAMEAIANFMYGDVLREVHHALVCIESGDRPGAIAACLRIKEVTQP